MKIIRALMNLNFKRCQVYKLNLSSCLTDRERDYYNLYCDGISQKQLSERLDGKKYYTPKMVSEVFHITDEQAKVLLENQLDKKYFREFLVDEVERFPKGQSRKVRKSALYITDENGKLIDKKRIDNRVVWTENECIRRCNEDLTAAPLLNQFVVMKCGSEALKGVLRQIIEHGVEIDDKHYIFYTSSTSQMKNAEITLLEENYWNENKYSLMCGLTEERINSKGGINMGKYFAAKALNISNSIRIDTDIRIEDVIIVPDFKTMVKGMVNYLDIDTLKIQEKEIEIEIEHMDGAGIFIPGTLPCSCQIRGGWLKGAVFPFDFHRFIRKYENKLSDTHMKDAWGKPVSIDEFLNAKMVLTDSQLKMRLYYDSMEEYRKCFNEAGVSITINNCAHEPGSEIRVAYQPFQTIPRKNLTDESIKNLTEKTIDYINDAKKEPKTALKLMGIDLESSENGSMQNFLYKSILAYPQLLNDVHVQKTMKNALLSERKKAQGSKLILSGLWSYICPDLFAFCQWLFLGDDTPEGLVPEGYIYNHYYDNKSLKETCCIRYPHLSDCEHGIRKVSHSKECKEWFYGNDAIVSCHDFISKVLQADFDGDHICLVHDEAFLNILDRNEYPLYYKMTKAEPAPISNEAIMTCLVSSFFDNEGIGFVSNTITKIFNSKAEPNATLARVLCAYNNFVIDYFKTQQSMDLKEYTENYCNLKDSKKSLCPYFFKYAKDKKVKQCADYNKNGNCDRIGRYVTQQTSTGISKIDYDNGGDSELFSPEMLKSRDLEVKRTSDEYVKLSSLLTELKSEKMQTYKKVKKDLEAKESDKQIFYIYCCVKIKKIIEDRRLAANYLVDIEYYDEAHIETKKDILWECFGDILYDNLCQNIKNDVKPLKRRNTYHSSSKREQEIIECREKVKKEQEELKTISISKNIYNYLMDVQTRRDRVNDKYIMFALYVLIERFKKRHGIDHEYIRLYKGTKSKNKCTCSVIDKWVGSQCTKKGLGQLQKKGYINIEELKNYYKISLNGVPQNSNSTEVFKVVSANPLFDLWGYNGDKKIGECKICKAKFVVTGNTKTCLNPECSRKLKYKNKNK